MGVPSPVPGSHPRVLKTPRMEFARFLWVPGRAERKQLKIHFLLVLGTINFRVPPPELQQVLGMEEFP